MSLAQTARKNKGGFKALLNTLKYVTYNRNSRTKQYDNITKVD